MFKYKHIKLGFLHIVIIKWNCKWYPNIAINPKYSHNSVLDRLYRNDFEL